MSYPLWCNEDYDPRVLLNQTCDVFSEEEKSVYIHALTLIVISMVPIVANYLPKYVVVCCFSYFNDKRQRYTRLKTPEEILTEKVVELTEQIMQLEDEVIERQDKNDEIKEDFAHRFSNMRYQLQLAKTALAKSVPTVEKFLRSLRLGKYVADMRANKVTTKKLIELRGDIGNLDDPEIEMKPGHLKKLQRGLYNVKRVMDFNYKYVERRADLELEARLEKERERREEDEDEERTRMGESSMLDDNPATEEVDWNEFGQEEELYTYHQIGDVGQEEGQYTYEVDEVGQEEEQQYAYADVTGDGQDYYAYEASYVEGEDDSHT
jgi:hypothetical protein